MAGSLDPLEGLPCWMQHIDTRLDPCSVLVELASAQEQVVSSLALHWLVFAAARLAHLLVGHCFACDSDIAPHLAVEFSDVPGWPVVKLDVSRNPSDFSTGETLPDVRAVLSMQMHSGEQSHAQTLAQAQLKSPVY